MGGGLSLPCVRMHIEIQGTHKGRPYRNDYTFIHFEYGTKRMPVEFSTTFRSAWRSLATLLTLSTEPREKLIASKNLEKLPLFRTNQCGVRPDIASGAT